MTLAESWAGLRKAWLGFKIAKANNDALLMTHYATFIRKVQIEMGIQVTELDPDILAPNIFDEPGDNETDGSHFYQEYPSDDIFTQEPDYDTIMDDARSSIDDRHESISAPRENIFGSSLTSPRNACMIPECLNQTKQRWNPTKVEECMLRRVAYTSFQKGIGLDDMKRLKIWKCTMKYKK